MMTPALAKLRQRHAAGMAALQRAREEIEWAIVWRSVPPPLLFLGRVGAAVTIGMAKIEASEVQQGRRTTAGPGLLALQELNTRVTRPLVALVRERLEAADDARLE